MIRRNVATVLALALSAGFAGSALAASPSSTRTTITTVSNTSTKGRLVSFHIRNDAGSTLTLQVGDQQMTVDAGKTASVRVQEGTQVVAVNAVGHVNAGAVIATVSSVLNGNTLAVN